jgi:hypothetical protein
MGFSLIKQGSKFFCSYSGEQESYENFAIRRGFLVIHPVVLFSHYLSLLFFILLLLIFAVNEFAFRHSPLFFGNTPS